MTRKVLIAGLVATITARLTWNAHNIETGSMPDGRRRARDSAEVEH